MVDIFLIFPLTMEIYCQDGFQKQSLLTNWIFFANQVIYFLKNQMKNSNELDDFGNYWMMNHLSEYDYCLFSLQRCK